MPYEFITETNLGIKKKVLKSFHVNGIENFCETVPRRSFQNSHLRYAVTNANVTILLHTFLLGLFPFVWNSYIVTAAENNKVSTNISGLLQSSFKINLQAPSCTHSNSGSAPGTAWDHLPADTSLHSAGTLSSPPAAFLWTEDSITTTATFRPPMDT